MNSLIGKKTVFALKKPIWWVGLTLSCAVALLFYGATSKSIEHDSRERFKVQARTAQQTIAAELKSYADLLHGTAGLFQVTGTLSRSQFHRYVASLSLREHFPAIETLNIARQVTEKERSAFELQADGEQADDDMPDYPSMQLKPPGRRDSYTVLSYVEPPDYRQALYGIDLAWPPARAKQLEQSRDSGDVLNNGLPSRLAERPGMVGMVMRMPVYRTGLPLSTQAERRAAYLGSVGIGFDLRTLIERVLETMPGQDLRVVLHDAGTRDQLRQSPASARDFLFDSQSGQIAAPDQNQPEAFSTTLLIDYNGRVWDARFSTTQHALYSRFDTYFPWLAMLAGFISTMLIYILFHTLSSSRMRAIQMAKAMTQKLRDSQAKLQMSHQKLRRLAAHADQIKEEERKRIAREIHDDLGQNLLVLRIDADMLASRTRHQHPRLNARARSTLSHIDATIKSVRQIINDLRPTVLDLGLNAAVEWQIAEFRRRTGIVCELNDHQTEILIDDHCATALFRILQESLSNIIQHAAASLVQVELVSDQRTLSMTVRDNGVGLHLDGRGKLDSFGLVGIEERVKLLGGMFSIHSSPGAGMTIRVTIPLDNDLADAGAYLSSSASLAAYRT